MKLNLVKNKVTEYTERTGFCEEYISQMNPLSKTVKEMKSMADMLVPHTWPQADFKVEQDVLCLKQRIITVDGYEVNVCLSRADYKKYILDSLQIQSQNGPFIPFNIVCKIGIVFFGKTLLSYIDFFRNDKKVYCWAIKHFDGKILNPSHSEPAEFEGFKYQILDHGSVDLF